MISYFEKHNFRLSANLHGGAEVMNYPWDSYTSAQLPHPESAWWIDVCRRFVDTSRTYNPSHFYDTYPCGYTAGGDWYVITGGRQDYFNYYYNCLELTMEISSTKKLSTNQLPTYWNFLQHSLVNYIEEIHTLPNNNSVPHVAGIQSLSVFPNPASDHIVINNATDLIELYDATGRRIYSQTIEQPNNHTVTIDISSLPAGIYLLRSGAATATVVKQP